MSRWFFFLIAIAFGVVLGLLYGWVLSPVEFVDTTPDTLGRYYKSDYVLMVAEAYKAERDLEAALRRLALLGNHPPEDIVREATLFAESQGYSDLDVNLMRALSSALESGAPGPETPAP
jgi:hypothetical protein